MDACSIVKDYSAILVSQGLKSIQDACKRYRLVSHFIRFAVEGKCLTVVEDDVMFSKTMGMLQEKLCCFNDVFSWSAFAHVTGCRPLEKTC